MQLCFIETSVSTCICVNKNLLYIPWLGVRKLAIEIHYTCAIKKGEHYEQKDDFNGFLF